MELGRRSDYGVITRGGEGAAVRAQVAIHGVPAALPSDRSVESPAVVLFGPGRTAAFAASALSCLNEVGRPRVLIWVGLIV